MCGMLDNVGNDLVDLDDEAGVRLRLRDFRVGVERPARQALTPFFGAYAQGVATLVALTGVMSFRTAPSVQHRIGWMNPS